MLELCWMHLLLADAVWVTVMTSRIESCWWIYEKWCWASAAGDVCPDCTTHLLSCSLILIGTHWYSLITHHHISPPAQPTWPCTPCLPCLPWSHCVTGGCLWCCWWCWCWWLSSVSRGWQVTGVWCVSAPAPLVTAPHPGSTALPPARTTLHTLRDEYSLLSHTCNMFPHTQPFNINNWKSKNILLNPVSCRH